MLQRSRQQEKFSSAGSFPLITSDLKAESVNRKSFQV